jgi:hypothetical protein
MCGLRDDVIKIISFDFCCDFVPFVMKERGSSEASPIFHSMPKFRNQLRPLKQTHQMEFLIFPSDHLITLTCTNNRSTIGYNIFAESDRSLTRAKLST